MTQGVSVVTFDGDETLWNFQSAMRKALGIAAQRFAAEGLSRRDGSPVTADWLGDVRENVARLPNFSNARMEDIRWAAFQEVSREVGADEEFTASVFKEFMDARHSSVTAYDDTAACLVTLKQLGFRLGLVTNGNSRPSVLGLDGAFEVIVVAADCGFRKPDPRIYHHAAERFGVEPSACAHVGDHVEEDVEAAAAAGMRSVWIDRAESHTKTMAWRTISRLEQLPALLGTELAS
ncbi:HAD family hydrolase [Streptomyces scabiei]|uniref:HAD family hydrolase n=1 Tax=Streptomyces scabiei TaxID=1930 RepID=UPI00298F5E88|nr:HAD family hydrolase [Streptomyces scabiei]MDW8804348.1 HAD family hydrolase [Streptomyces scabiei]